MKKIEAYKIVFEDLKQIPLFTGQYDALNGNEQYMYGIWGVMERIAFGVSEECADSFNERFAYHMMKSEEKYYVGSEKENKNAT